MLNVIRKSKFDQKLKIYLVWGNITLLESMHMYYCLNIPKFAFDNGTETDNKHMKKT